MALGNFFIVNEQSNPVKGQMQFYYIAHKSKKEAGPQYPVYVTFNDDIVNFYLHGFVGNDNDLTPEEIKLFSLHLHNDEHTQKALNNTLKELFNKKDKFSFKEIVLNKSITYKDLEQLKYRDENRAEINKFFRHLLLDFLYDVKHSNVFDNSPAFSKIKRLLKEPFFIQAVTAKAEFYYQYTLLKGSTENHVLYISHNDKFKTDLNNAISNWLGILQEKDAYKIINTPNKWFTDVETEVSNALDFEKEAMDGETGYVTLKTTITELREKTSKWFIKRNNIYRAWLNNSWFEKGVFWSSLVLIVYVIGVIITFIYDKTIDKEPLKLIELNTDSFSIPFIYLIPIATILIGILFNWSFRNILSKINGLFKYLLIPLWVLIFGATHVVFNTGSFYNRLFIKNDWTHEFSGYFVGLLLTIFFYKLIHYAFKWLKERKSIKKWLNNLKLDYWKGRKQPTKLMPDKILLNIIVHSSISFLIFKYLLNSFHPNSLFLYLAILLILVGILYNHERESHPNLEKTTSINKTLSMLFYGLVISLFTNLFYINTEYKEYIEQYEYLGQIWHKAEKSNSGLLKRDSLDSTIYYLKENNCKNYDQEKQYDATYDFEMEGFKKGNVKLRYKQHYEIKDYSHFYIYENGDDSINFNKIKSTIYKPISDHIEVTIDDIFFTELQHLYLLTKTKKGCRKYKKALVPVLKEININGIKIITIPSVLFINTFLSLLIAIVLQIFLHKHKFLKG